MATYLLTWNPARWKWDDLDERIAEVKQQGYYVRRWSAGVTKRIQRGDRVFLMKLGAEPRGIVAAGWAETPVYQAEHWDEAKRHKGLHTNHIDARFEVILDPEGPIFPRQWLEDPEFAGMQWSPHGSGARIPDEVAAKLEVAWSKFLHEMR